MTSGPPPPGSSPNANGASRRVRRAAGEPGAQRRGGERGDEVADVLHLVVGELDVPLLCQCPHRLGVGRRGAREVEVLEQRVDERPARGGRERGRGLGVGPRRRLDRRQPEQPLEVEPVAAAPVRAERAVREPLRRRSRPHRRRRQHLRRVGQAPSGRAPTRGRPSGASAERGRTLAERGRRVEDEPQPRRAIGPVARRPPVSDSVRAAAGSSSSARAIQLIGGPSGRGPGQRSQSMPPERISRSRARVIAT